MSVDAKHARLPYRGIQPELKQLLAERFGEAFTTADAIREQHGRGEGYHQSFDPDAVLFAQSAEQVSAVVKLCAEHRTPIIPYGAGTSLEGNFAALAGGLTLDLSQMDRIIAVNSEDMDCTIQPGVTRIQLNEYLRDTGLFFPVD